jgi:DinB superfamily
MAALRTQLADIEKQLKDLQNRAHRLADSFDEEQWIKRLRPGRWSPTEYLIHLNKTSDIFLPQLREKIVAAKENRQYYRGDYRKDLAGRFLCWIVEPPARMRTKTMPRFVPTEQESKAVVLSDFDRLQEQIIGLLPDANELDLSSIRVVSPFNEKMKYNLYSAFCVIAAHQRRHFWQIEQLSKEVAS